MTNECYVLIIGSGFAGLNVVVAARNADKSVVLVYKGAVDSELSFLVRLVSWGVAERRSVP